MNKGSAEESNVFWKRVSIPKGLPSLLEILAKETIRENPKDIIAFLSKLVDDLIAKRDQEEDGSEKEASGKGSKPKSEEENPLLDNVQGLSGKYTKSNEEDKAASKIQAGFRGWKSRKSLKSNVKKKGGDLSLTSLTPLNEDEGDEVDSEITDDEEAKRLEKAKDEAIAAEIKTPLETIREESIEGRLHAKTPDLLHHPNHLESETIVGDRPTSADLNIHLPHPESCIIQEESIEEEEEAAVSCKDSNYICGDPLAKNASNETAEVSIDEPIIVSNVNELLTPVDIDDEPTGEEESTNNNVSEEGISVEIKETEVETLLEAATDLSIDNDNDNDQESGKGGSENDDAEIVDEIIKKDEKAGADDNDEEEVFEKTEKNSSEETEEIVHQELPNLKSSIDKVEEAELINTNSNDVPATDKVDIGSTIELKELEEAKDVPELNEDIPTTVPLSIESESTDVIEVIVNPNEDLEVLKTPDEPDNIPKEDEAETNEPHELEEKIKKCEDDIRQDVDTVINAPVIVESTPSNPKIVEKVIDDLIIDKPDNPDLDEPSIPEKIIDDAIIIKTEETVLPEEMTNSKETESKLLTKSESLMDANIDFIDETNVDQNADTPPENSNNNMSSESPSLMTKCDEPSFANTDSLSSPVTVRAADFDKRQDSSQEISSRSDTPIAKPRKPASVPVDEISSDQTDILKRQRLEESQISDESKEAVAELKKDNNDEPTPVLRRQKSNPKNRAMSSKYRSGFVMDDSVSMEEMEAQIENEMMSHAATKIQAGFRGYKTRKSIRHSGVRFADNNATSSESTSAKSEDKSLNEDDNVADDAIEVSIIEMAASACAFEPSPRSASVCENPPSPSALGRGSRPPLAFLRSRSYPGSHEDDVHLETSAEEPDVVPHEQLEYDPAYVNNAAIKIQSSVRGFLVRRSFKNKKGPPKNLRNSESENQEPENIGELVIIDIADRDSVSPMSEDVQSEQAATKIQSVFRGYKDRQKCRQTKKAVVTIQATVRGFLTRRRLAKLRRYINSPIKRRSMQRRRSSAKSVSHEVQRIMKANEAAAATKIQAVYRGYQVRSKIRKNPNDE